MFALNQGEVCTCPSRALIQESIYDKFLIDAVERVGKITQGNPLDTDTMIGAQASNDQLEKILSYIDIGKQEGAKVLTGGDAPTSAATSPAATTSADRVRGAQQDAHLPGGDLRPGRLGDHLRRTRTTRSRSPTTPSTASAPACGAATGVGLPRRARDPGRPGVDQLLPRLPAHAAFGGYKQSGIGRENHKMMLDHYQQTKNLLVLDAFES
jgi:aldehyde dehydrogenase